MSILNKYQVIQLYQEIVSETKIKEIDLKNYNTIINNETIDLIEQTIKNAIKPEYDLLILRSYNDELRNRLVGKFKTVSTFLTKLLPSRKKNLKCVPISSENKRTFEELLKSPIKAFKGENLLYLTSVLKKSLDCEGLYCSLPIVRLKDEFQDLIADGTKQNAQLLRKYNARMFLLADEMDESLAREYADVVWNVIQSSSVLGEKKTTTLSNSKYEAVEIMVKHLNSIASFSHAQHQGHINDFLKRVPSMLAEFSVSEETEYLRTTDIEEFVLELLNDFSTFRGELIKVSHNAHKLIETLACGRMIFTEIKTLLAEQHMRMCNQFEDLLYRFVYIMSKLSDEVTNENGFGEFNKLMMDIGFAQTYCEANHADTNSTN